MGPRGGTASGGRRLSRIAFLTPLPPERTGIADYSATVLAELGARIDVDVYCKHPFKSRIPGVRIRGATPRGFRHLDRYDAVVAQVGNSPAHEWIVDWIRHRPSAVVLHELVLHHLVAHMTLGRGQPAEYIDALRRGGGADVVPQAIAAMSGRAAALWEVAADHYPLEGFVTTHATSLLVHSHHMAEAVRAHGLGGDVAIIPFPARRTERPPPASLDRNRPVTLGVFGFITPNKRLPIVLAAFRRALARVGELRLLVVGGATSGMDLSVVAAQSGVPAGAVRFEDYSVRSRYEALLSEVDLGVSLRHPTFGETSAAVVDFMGHGIPVVVSTGGWYDELPDAAVARVGPDDDEVLTLAATLEHLARDAVRRRAMGEAAFEYTRTILDPARTADAYIRALLVPAGRRGLEESFLRSLARSVGEVSTVFDASREPLVEAVGKAAGEIGLMSPEGR